MSDEAAAAPAASPGPLVLVHALAWVPFLLYMLKVVPRMKVFFAETGVRVPHLTTLVLEWSDFLVGLGPLWLVGLLMFLAADFAILHQLKQTRRTFLYWTWFIMLTLMPAASWLLSWFAVWLTADNVLHHLAA
jgi:type II secretory pathway component PulF